MSDATYEGNLSAIEHRNNILNSNCYCFTENEFNSAKSRQQLNCKCAWCGKRFTTDKHTLQRKIKKNDKFITCSTSCALKFFHLTSEQKELDGYYCETCGKFVPWINSYSSKRFCCASCAKKYSNTFTQTQEAFTKKSKSITTVHVKKYPFAVHKNVPYYTDEQSHKIINLADIEQMQSKWSIYDIPELLHINRIKFLQFIHQNNIKEYPEYVNHRAYKIIQACRNFLNKPIQSGSITLKDLKTVQNACTHLIQVEDVTAREISLDYLKLDKHNSAFLSDGLHIDLLSSADAVSQFYIKNGTYDNWPELKKYRTKCRFTYMHNILAFLPGYELLEKFGWYNPKNNLDGVSRDHMISIQHGWEHNIDSYLISHPANCMLMQMRENSSKQDKCSLTLQELIERVEWFNNTILCCKERNRCSIKTNLKFHCSDIFSQNEIKHFSMLAYE